MNEVEQSILEQLKENLTEPFNYGAEGEVRGYVADAIDYICFYADFCTRSVVIPLEGNTHLYLLLPEDSQEMVVKILGVYLRGQDRYLTARSIFDLSEINPTWLKSNGSPYSYVHLGFNKILLYPIPSSQDDLIEVSMVIVPAPYSTDKELIRIWSEFDTLIIDFVQGMIYCRGMNQFTEGIRLIKNFFEALKVPRKSLQDLNALYYRRLRGVDER